MSLTERKFIYLSVNTLSGSLELPEHDVSVNKNQPSVNHLSGFRFDSSLLHGKYTRSPDPLYYSNSESSPESVIPLYDSESESNPASMIPLNNSQRPCLGGVILFSCLGFRCRLFLSLPDLDCCKFFSSLALLGTAEFRLV